MARHARRTVQTVILRIISSRSVSATKPWFDRLTIDACPELVEGCFRVFVALENEPILSRVDLRRGLAAGCLLQVVNRRQASFFGAGPHDRFGDGSRHIEGGSQLRRGRLV